MVGFVLFSDIYHEDHQKIYQNFYYKRSTTHAKVDYKL